MLKTWAYGRSSDDDPALTEEFECFAGRMEIRDTFSEISDAEEKEARFSIRHSKREAGDALAEEGDPDYVEALSYGMPPTGGLGLGIDRLTMVLTGRGTIRDVALFPALRGREA